MNGSPFPENDSAAVNGDDRSTAAHRRFIGIMGLSLPVMLYVANATFPLETLTRWGFFESISSYYHSAGSALFVGSLCALAVALFTYQGYANEHQWQDRTAAIIAGIAALGVALFPTSAPEELRQLAWWTEWSRWTWWREWMKTCHYVSAGILFASFAFFSLWQFTRSKTGKSPYRILIYRICGYAIILCIVWICVFGRSQPIFIPEVIALVAFGISWLTKGKADKAIVAVLHGVSAR